jgi:glycosyltransferase involved in cell wall biosynthesis
METIEKTTARLKLLIVSRQERSRSFATLFDGIAKHFDTTVIKLSKLQIRDFANTVNGLGYEGYDRVVFDVPLRRIGRHYKVLRKISGLILYEEDAWQEFSRHSRYYNKFIRIYQSIGACRLVLTGYNIGEKFKSTGLDVAIVPKAYDENHLRNLGVERDIELGFVGRIKNRIYRDRRPFLESLVAKYGLQMLRTAPGDEYLQTLNRIKIFVSADLGFLEYMAKNFEAMSCGCMLFANRQGGVEEESLGFMHMENVVLYNDPDDARKLLAMLKENPALVKGIASKGEELVRERHTLGARVLPFVDAIKAEIKPVPVLQRPPSRWRRFFGG